MSDKPQRAVIYVRLSVHRGDTDPSVSPAAQEERCRAYATAKGWEVVEVVRDLDVSGSDKGPRLDRPGLDRIRELFECTDVVIFAKLDRLARNVVDFRTFAEEAERHGTVLVSVAESLDLSTASGRFVSTILAAFAEMEAATIADRVRLARAELYKLDRWGGGPPPIGYESAPNPNGPGRILVPSPTVAPVIREAARRIVEGDSIYSATKFLNASGVKPPRAASWSVQALKQALTGDSIMGHVRRKGALLRNDDGTVRQVWEPVLEKQLWHDVNRVLDDRSADRSPVGQRTTRRSRLLSGIAVCGECQSPMYVRPQPGRPTHIYRCPALSNGRPCAGVAVTAERLEEYVADEYLKVFGTYEFVVVRPVERPVTALLDARRALKEVTSRLNDEDLSEAEESILTTEASALRRTLREHRDSDDKAPEVERIATGETLRQVWDRSTTLDRRAMLIAAIDGLLIAKGTRGRKGLDPARVEILWKYREPAFDAAMAA